MHTSKRNAPMTFSLVLNFPSEIKSKGSTSSHRFNDSREDPRDTSSPKQVDCFNPYCMHEKLRLREVKSFVQGHTDRTRILTHISPIPKPSLFQSCSQARSVAMGRSVRGKQGSRDTSSDAVAIAQREKMVGDSRGVGQMG